MKPAPTITITDATVRFGDHAAVNGLSASIPPGSFTAVIGPNGCGKSTLLRSLCHLRPLDEGRITVVPSTTGGDASSPSR